VVLCGTVSIYVARVYLRRVYTFSSSKSRRKTGGYIRYLSRDRQVVVIPRSMDRFVVSRRSPHVSRLQDVSCFEAAAARCFEEALPICAETASSELVQRVYAIESRLVEGHLQRRAT